MKDRHAKLGIKQTIQRHWMDKTVQMLLAGMSEKELRTELRSFLETQLQRGGTGARGEKSCGMAIGILSSWFSPDANLLPFRNDALSMARQLPSEKWLPLHWAVISASYPFWFTVARQVGRLFNLQAQITQSQVVLRLKERYGDRETVTRNARYAVRSFVAWRTMKDTETRGCYEKSAPVEIVDPLLAMLMIESALLATPGGKGSLGMLLDTPAFFAFQLPVMTGGFISQRHARIEVVRYGLDEELLQLKE